MATPQEAIVIIRDAISTLSHDCTSTSHVRVIDLLSIIAQKAQLKEIEFISVNWNHKHIKGQLLRYGDHAQVRVNSGINSCWTRFVAAKELAHLLLDTSANHFTTDVEGLLDRLMNNQWSTEKDMESERLAVIGAIELLIPQCCHAQLASMEAAETKHLEIARHFMVPEKMIDKRLSDVYKQRIAEAYKDL